MRPKVYKLGDIFLETNASERQLQVIINSLKEVYNDCFEIGDVIRELDKRGFLAEEVYINTNIQGW